MWVSNFAKGCSAAHGSADAALPLIGSLLSVGPVFAFLDQWNVVADCACLLKRRLLVCGWLSFLFVHLGKCAVCCELLPADPGELVRVNAHFHHLASA